MALPFSPTTTYVDDNLPAISAQDMNDLQKYVSGDYSQTISKVGTVIDGVGNNSYVQTTKSPLLIAGPSSGPRWWIERNGYPAGHFVQYVEDWGWAQGASLNSNQTPINGTLGVNTRWGVQFGNAAGSNVLGYSGNPSASYPLPTMNLTPGTNASDYVRLIMGQTGNIFSATYVDAVLEFDFMMSNAASGNNVNFQLGFVFGNVTAGLFNASNSGMWFQKLSADTNWSVQTANASSFTNPSTGVAPVASTMQRFRVEYHGSATRFGAATVVFFINETLVNTVTTTVPAATTLGISFLGSRAAANSVGSSLGRVMWAYNLFADPMTPL